MRGSVFFGFSRATDRASVRYTAEESQKKLEKASSVCSWDESMIASAVSDGEISWDVEF